MKNVVSTESGYWQSNKLIGNCFLPFLLYISHDRDEENIAG